MAHLIPTHIIGLKGSLKDSIHFIDEAVYVYVSGHNVVVTSTEHRQQKVLPGSNDTNAITAIAVSPTKKLVAIAEGTLPIAGGQADSRYSTLSSDSRSSAGGDHKQTTDTKSQDGESRDSDQRGLSPESKASGPIISLWETGVWKKRKVLSGSEALAGMREYVSISFSADGRNIAAQGCGPDWILVLWSLEKSKIFATVKASIPQAQVYQVQYCLSDASLVSVVGDGFAKTFKLTETAFRQIATDIAKWEGKNFIWHTWLAEAEHAGKDSCIYSLDTGELVRVEGGEIMATLPPSSTDGSSVVEIMLLYSKGIICGERGGSVSIYERVDEKEVKEGLKKVCAFKVDKGGATICGLALSTNEELLGCTLSNNHLVTIPFQHRDLFKQDEIPKELAAQAYHFGRITGIDICTRKPIVVTCGADKSVRVWNYHERTCEIVKSFHEDAFSVALHPSGLHVLVGFSDKLRFMNLLIDDIRLAKEIGIKSCQECTFSNGGQFFAAVHNNVVQIFSTYTCENIGNLRGHSGKVQYVWWSSDDTFISTAGLDGAIYEWRVKDYKRNRENVLKGCAYTCVAGAYNANTFIAVGSDRKLKEMDETQIVKSFNSAALLTQISLSDGSRLLFAGTEFGGVRSYRYPLTGEYQEVQASSAYITRMVASYDANLLFVAGEDGVLSIFDVKDREKALVIGALRREKEAFGWAEEVLITKTDLEEMRAHMQELEEKVSELKTDNEYQMRLKDISLNEKVKAINDSFQRQIEEAQSRYDKLLQEKNQEELNLEEKQVYMEERHLQQLKELEEQWQQKMMQEVQRYSSLSHEKDMLNERWEEQNAAMLASHEQIIQELTEEFETKLEEEHQAYEKLQHEIFQTKKDFEEIKKQTEEDTDKEIEEIKLKYEARLAQEADTILRLKGENGLLKKKFNEFQKDIEEQKAEIKQLFEQKKELYSTLGFFERDIASLKKDVSERDDTIGEKEKRIFELKRKTQELEKVKFVLDYKIKDLKQTIEPRELELQNAKLQIANMEKELERAHNGNTRKELIIAEMKLKVDGLRIEEANMRTKIHKTSELIKSFNCDFYHLTQLIQEPRALKDAVKELNKKYGTHKVKIVPVDQDLKKELTRHREYLERNVEGLQRKLAKDTAAYHKSHLVIMQENVILINELNELRRELKVMKLNAHRGPQFKSEDSASMAKEIEAMRVRIGEMQMQMGRKQDEVKQLETILASKERDNERMAMVSEKRRDVMETSNSQSVDISKLKNSQHVDFPSVPVGQEESADSSLEQSSTLKEVNEVGGGADMHVGGVGQNIEVIENNEVNLQDIINGSRKSFLSAEAVEERAALESEEKPSTLPNSDEIHPNEEMINAAEGLLTHEEQTKSELLPPQPGTMPARDSIKDQGIEEPSPLPQAEAMAPRESIEKLTRGSI
ncbi:hypothetical protein GOP47_0019512 [Adiantum capillus-veneris]|uniref:Uncharacterized protein n=1 Tax=Adiantum capillus-veneris TaxID=13818 RepID=A0A9D4UBM2_ADICA|nr:hypothetical protein GOP47_0019512 [Adiantum capillus-veneris]